MKKAYQKPEIIFESFALSECIAAGCEMIAGTHAEYVCPVTVKGWDFTIFALAACDTQPAGGHDSVCYHVPMADNNVFNS